MTPDSAYPAQPAQLPERLANEYRAYCSWCLCRIRFAPLPSNAINRLHIHLRCSHWQRQVLNFVLFLLSRVLETSTGCQSCQADHASVHQPLLWHLLCNATKKQSICCPTSATAAVKTWEYLHEGLLESSQHNWLIKGWFLVPLSVLLDWV